MSHTATTSHDVSGPPHVHHMDPPTAYHAAKFGMWLFLATELLLFGGLFAAFAIYRWQYFDEFHEASKELDVRWGTLNTAILLFSSYLAVLALDAAQHGNNKKCVNCIWGTLTCAVGFLVVKGIEYYGKASHGLFPRTMNHHGVEFKDYAFSEYGPYFGLYYCMTGLHALHVIIGMGILIWVLRKAQKNRFSEEYYTPVELGALYWHFVDVIWIYLFPLLYLVG